MPCIIGGPQFFWPKSCPGVKIGGNILLGANFWGVLKRGVPKALPPSFEVTTPFGVFPVFLVATTVFHMGQGGAFL